MNPERPLAAVFSGGGARGAFQAGVWKTLRSHPRGLSAVPTILSGTSAGAINSVLIAAGRSPDEVLEFWFDLAKRPPVRANEAFFDSLRSTLFRMAVREPVRSLRRRAREARIAVGLVRKHRLLRRSGLEASLLEFLLTARFDNVSELLDGITTTHLFETDDLRERLKKAIGGVTLKTETRLAINCVDAQTGGILRIVNAPPRKRTKGSSKHYKLVDRITVDMVVASASIPLLFNPVRVDGMVLWDGGLLVNSPMAPAVALGARRVIPVLVTPDAPSFTRMNTMGAAIERAADVLLENAYNIDRKLMLERNELAERMPEKRLQPVELLKAIRPAHSDIFNAGSYLDFTREALERMFEAGQASAKAWLEQDDLVDPGLFRGDPVEQTA